MFRGHCYTSSYTVNHKFLITNNQHFSCVHRNTRVSFAKYEGLTFYILLIYK